MLTILALLALSLSPQDQDTLPVLSPDKVVRGVISDADSEIRTARLDGSNTISAARGDTYRLAVEEDGVYTVELRSDLFDAYLVLRNTNGDLLEQDNDGLLVTHARIVVELEKDRPYFVQACALRGERGAYELTLSRGEPEQLSDEQKEELETVEARRIVSVREEALGPEHSATLEGFHNLAKRLVDQRELVESEQLARRVLGIREREFGSEHPDTAASLSLLAYALFYRGEYEEAERRARRGLEIRENVFGEVHLGIGRSLTVLSLILGAQDRYEESEPLRRRVVEIRENVVGIEDRSMAAALYYLAYALDMQDKFEESEQVYRRSIEIYERVLGEHPITAVVLAELAGLLTAQEKSEQAEPLYRRAIEIRERVQGSRSNMAWALYDLAILVQSDGRFEEAELLFRRALEIFKTVEGSGSATASTAEWLGSVLYNQNKYEESEQQFRRTLEITEKLWGPDDLEVARVVGSLGAILGELGRFGEAEKLLRRSLRIREEQLGSEHPDLNITLSALAEMFLGNGDLEQVEPLYHRMLEVTERSQGPESPDTADVLQRMGDLLLGQGKNDEAESAVRRARRIFENAGIDDRRIADSLMTEGQSQLYRGAEEEAVGLFRAAHESYERILGREHSATNWSLTYVAIALLHQREYKEAESHARQAVEIAERLYGDNPRLVLMLPWFQEILASVLAEQGRHNEAEPLARQALEVVRRELGDEDQTTVRSMNSLAEVLLDQGKTQEAWQLYESGFRTTSNYLSNLFANASEAERFRYSELEAKKLLYLVTLAADTEAGRDQPAKRNVAYEALLSSKGRIFRSTAWLREKLFGGLNPEQSRRVEELHGVQGQLSRLVSSRKPSESRRLLGDLVERMRQLEDELVRSIGSGWSEEPLDVIELARDLTAGSVLLDFQVRAPYRPWTESQDSGWDPERLSAWILHSGSEYVNHLDLGPASDVEAAVQEYLTAVVPKDLSRAADDRRPPMQADEPEAAAKLRKLLWDPLREEVGNAELVIVSPDMFVATMPFEILQEEDGSFLIEKHRFVYTQDAMSLTELRERNTTTIEPSLLAIGAVDYDLRAEIPSEALAPREELRAPVDGVWGLLRETRAEVDGIEKLHRQVNREADRSVLSAEKATEEELKLSMPHFRFLHFATHGFFDPGRWQSYLAAVRKEPEEAERAGAMRMILPSELPGLLSGLALAGANLPREEDREDGLLTAEEVAWLDLRACELVVLSACQTGLGLAEGGEGLMSLRRSFRQAGARTVISSLWKVQDESTRELMLDFYGRYWQEGQGVLKALRNAQLEMLRRNREEKGEALPATWGAFVLSGDWR